MPLPLLRRIHGVKRVALFIQAFARITVFLGEKVENVGREERVFGLHCKFLRFNYNIS